MRHSRSPTAAWALIACGALILLALLGKSVLSDHVPDIPRRSFFLALGGYLVLSGACLLLWNRTIFRSKITGKEFFLRSLLAGAPFALLACVEIGLRLSDWINQPDESDDVAATRLMAGKRGELLYGDYKLFRPSENPLFRINRLGFRTYDFDRPKADEVRIILLGGSTAFGWAVADAHTIGSNIEAYLKRRLKKTVLVYNLGVPAGHFRDENRFLSDFARTIDPQLIVYYHGANDGYGWYQQSLGKADAKSTLDPPLFSIAALLDMAHQFRVFVEVSNLVESFSPAREPLDIDLSLALRDYQTHLETAQELCKAYQCLYFLQPTIFEKRHRTKKDRKIIRDTLRRFPGVDVMYEAYIDALLAKSLENHFDARPPVAHVRGEVFFDHVHATALGNRLLARFIGETICAKQVLRCQ